MSEQKKNYYSFTLIKKPIKTTDEASRKILEELPETKKLTCNLTDEQVELLKFLDKENYNYYIGYWGKIKNITDFN